MPVLCDTQIRELVPIEPFADAEKRPGRISYGVSSYGYDVRVGTLFKIFTNAPTDGGMSIVDPKNFDDRNFVTVDTDDPASGGGRDHVIVP
ncbi:MAG: dCTP deaminase, partial [Planctomycetota bacterium]